MRILVVTSIFPPEIGGPATYVKEFASRARDRGHEVRIVTLSDAKPDDLEAVEIRSVKRGGNKLLRQSALLKRIMESARKCDVIYAQNPTAIGLPSVLAGKLLRKPAVIKFVGDTAWEKAFREGKTEKGLEDFLKKPDANRKILRIERSVLKGASKIVTPGRFLARILKKYHKVPGERIVVIPNAVDVGSVKPKPLRQRENRIITVARLVPWKGVQDLISVMPEVRKATGAELRIVGDGPYKSELEKLASKVSPDGVRFLGRLSHEEVLRIVGSSKVFALNSLYEGMPHVLLEAMALGTPVVATNVCGNPELVEDGKTGVLVKPRDRGSLKDALVSLLQDEKKLRSLSSAARDKASDYNWESLMSRTLKAIGP